MLGSYNMSLRGFIEEKIELGNIEYIKDIKMIDDGTIKLIGADNNLKEIVLISENKGKTWIEKELESTDLKEDSMFFFSVFNNGDILAIDGSENTNKFILIKDNESIRDIYIDNNNFMAVNVSQNNDILVYDVYNIYLYNLKDGKLKKEINIDDEIISVCTTDKYLIVQTVQAMKKYNLNNGEFIEDIEELQEYIDRDITYKLKLFNSREDDEILLIDSIGIYSVNAKDYNTNQMIDANAYLFNSTEKELAHFLQLDSENFLAVYYGEDGMEMYTYSYSDKLANKELEEITIYSLYESESILQYSSQYQNDNPNIVINYEVGITKDSGQTENDAIKTLNTE